ncbi:MAG: glycerol-3-phosphate 1-O-acyltransferase PlsY [Hyphomonadaceae bacterium]
MPWIDRRKAAAAQTRFAGATHGADTMSLTLVAEIIFATLGVLMGYLLGSIPFGLVLTKLAGLGDIRAIGSGNIGATNVLRTGRKDLALATLLLDAGKAGIAFLLAQAATYYLVHNHIPLGLQVDIWHAPFRVGLCAGAAAFIGHCFPIWLKFKGGKGVATFIGLLLASMWQVGIGFGLTWLVVAGVFRISSLAALVATALVPVLAYVFGYGEFAVGVTLALALLIYWRHSANIARLLKGTEPRIGAKKDVPPA